MIVVHYTFCTLGAALERKPVPDAVHSSTLFTGTDIYPTQTWLRMLLYLIADVPSCPRANTVAKSEPTSGPDFNLAKHIGRDLQCLDSNSVLAWESTRTVLMLRD